MIRKSLAWLFVSLFAVSLLVAAGCSGPDAPPKKSGSGGGKTNKSLTTDSK